MDDWKDWFEWFRLGDWAETGIEEATSSLSFLLTFLRDLLVTLYNALESFFISPPWWLVIVTVGMLAWLATEDISRRRAARNDTGGQTPSRDTHEETSPGPAPSRDATAGAEPTEERTISAQPQVVEPSDAQPARRLLPAWGNLLGWRTGVAVMLALLIVDASLWTVDRLGPDLAIVETYGGPYDLLDLYRPSFLLFVLPSSWVMILLLGLLAGVARGVLFGIGATASLLLIDLMDQWNRAMQTLSMITVAVAAATLIAIPIGIWAARSRIVSSIVRPVLDFMQTMPALIYVLIAVVMFRVGVVPGIVATLIFAMPPAIRLTELGIRQVDSEVVEAGKAFGSTPNKILRQIQIPLALPTIMAGVNQVIMLSLSMVVLAGFVGAPGLGQQVISAISRTNLSLGVEAGLSVVILAIYLDRVTAAFGARSTVARLDKTA